MIEAVYAEGKLKDIILHPVSGKNDVISVSGIAGSRYMLWSSLSGMKPLAETLEIR